MGDDESLARAERSYGSAGSVCLWVMAGAGILGACLSATGSRTWRPYWVLLPFCLGLWIGALGIFWRREPALFGCLIARLHGLQLKSAPGQNLLPGLSEHSGQARLQWVLVWLVILLPAVFQSNAQGELLPVHLIVFGCCLGASAWLRQGPEVFGALDKWLSVLERNDDHDPPQPPSLAGVSWPLRAWSVVSVLLAVALLVWFGIQAFEASQLILRAGVSARRVLQLGALAGGLPLAAVVVLLPAWARRARRFQHELRQQGAVIVAAMRGEQDRSTPRPEVERLVLLGRLLAIAATLATLPPLILGVVVGLSAPGRGAAAGLLPCGFFLPLGVAIYCLGQFCRLRSLRWQVWVGLQDGLLQKIELGQWPLPADSETADAEALNPEPPAHR